MRTRYKLTYLSGITNSGHCTIPHTRQIEVVDVGLQRLVESVYLNFGFAGSLEEWVTPAALLSVETIGPVE